MIFNINSTRGQTRFLACVARVTCLVGLIGLLLRQSEVRENSQFVECLLFEGCSVDPFHIGSYDFWIVRLVAI